MQDDLFVFLAVQNLDSESVKAWELHLGPSQDPPTWKQLLEFLLTRLLTLKAVAKELLVKKNRLCFNCLGPHRVSDCRSTRRCMKCSKKHHTTIHRANWSENPDKSNISTTNENSTSEISAQINCASVNHASSSIQKLLATIQLYIISEQGEKIQARALVDPGSQISLTSEKLAHYLQLSRKHSSIPLIGIGAVKAGRNRGLVSVRLTPHFESPTECRISAYIFPKLTSRISSVKVNDSTLTHLKNLQLADPQFQSPGLIDLIIGADYYGQILQEGIRQGSARSPTAQSTIFGWTLFGPNSKLLIPIS